VQVGGEAAPCVTVIVAPATVAVPTRDPPVFSAHETVVEPDPLPVVEETVSHEPLPDAVHVPPVHPVGDPVTATPDDPAAEVGLADVQFNPKTVQVSVPPPPRPNEKTFDSPLAPHRPLDPTATTRAW
jgi:hypothetical protein